MFDGSRESYPGTRSKGLLLLLLGLAFGSSIRWLYTLYTALLRTLSGTGQVGSSVDELLFCCNPPALGGTCGAVSLDCVLPMSWQNRGGRPQIPTTEMQAVLLATKACKSD